jgi:hypothetical protein
LQAFLVTHDVGFDRHDAGGYTIFLPHQKVIVQRSPGSHFALVQP